MRRVLTLIAARDGLEPSVVDYAAETLQRHGGEVAQTDWLEPGTACDLFVTGGEDDEHIETSLRQALASVPVDFALQPEAGRRKRLLVADMDSTILTGESLDELAAHRGLKDKIAAITARAMNGELDFAAAVKERVAMLAGLPESAIDETLAEMTYSDGAASLVATMRHHGAFCVLVSGGFKPFTQRVRETLGFDNDRGNQLEIVDGKLTGVVLEPILDKNAKLEALNEFAAIQGLPLSATMTVGDGANDLMMIEAACEEGGLGVAFHAKPSVAAKARYRIDHTDLASLLYFQGYRGDEIQ